MRASWLERWAQTCPPTHVGGGEQRDTEVTANDLFRKIVAWDKNNFLIGAGTDGKSDKNSTFEICVDTSFLLRGLAGVESPEGLPRAKD